MATHAEVSALLATCKVQAQQAQQAQLTFGAWPVAILEKKSLSVFVIVEMNSLFAA